VKSALAVVVVACVMVAGSRAARAEGNDAPAYEGLSSVPTSTWGPPLEEPFADKPGYRQFFATAMGGTGLRFNNPYRLATPLGSNAESVSRTAAYLDLGLAATFNNPLGWQSGVAFRVTTALEGVGQTVLTPSYFGFRRKGKLAAYGRAGIPLVVSPDVTWGLEGAVGGALFFLGGMGLVAEIIGDVFYGEGTRERSVATYPILSGQLGFVGTFEVLP
jgi:hypothetical protein